MFQTKHLELIYQCFSTNLHFIIMYQINCIAKSSSFFVPLLPLCFYSPSLELPSLFYCSSSRLPFFLCFLNLLKAFFISPQSQNRSSSVSFCPQTLYLLSETKQSQNCQAISCFSYIEGKHWSMPWINSILLLILLK